MPFRTLNAWCQEHYGEKLYKIALDAGFTCPNRDGTLGDRGCIFCSAGGSGDFAAKRTGSLRSQLDAGRALLSHKKTGSRFIAYFQAYTNTYGPVDRLEELFSEALSEPDIAGISIATRPDCLPDHVLDLLEEINEQHFLWVELGLQTVRDDVRRQLNVGYTLEDYDRAVRALRERGIRVVTHLILGLPGESEEDMFRSLHHVTDGGIFGLKLHLMNLVKGSPLAEEMPNYTSFPSMDAYVDLVCRMIPQIPPEITIHRLTGDVPRKLLLTPEWSYMKRTILNTIHHELAARDLYQGSAL